MSDSPLNSALRHFEAAEANLVKAEKVLSEIDASIPTGIVFGGNLDHETNCRNFDELLVALPKIDGWKPSIYLMELDDIAQSRLDAQEVGEIECLISIERQINEPSKLLRDYRYRFNQKRRELIRDALVELIDSIDANLRILSPLVDNESTSNDVVNHLKFEEIKQSVAQINTLLGRSVGWALCPPP